MAEFTQTLMTALAIGSLYALIALGYTMVYGILKFINFAHSDIVVLGAWVSYALAGKILRIGLMGHTSNNRNVLLCLSALEAALAQARSTAPASVHA